GGSPPTPRKLPAGVRGCRLAPQRGSTGTNARERRRGSPFRWCQGGSHRSCRRVRSRQIRALCLPRRFTPPLFSLVLPLERTSNANGEADVLRRFIRSSIRKRRHEPRSHVLLLAGSHLRAPPDHDVRFGRLLKSALLEELLPFVLWVIAQGPVDREVAATAEIFVVYAIRVRHNE